MWERIQLRLSSQPLHRNVVDLARHRTLIVVAQLYPSPCRRAREQLIWTRMEFCGPLIPLPRRATYVWGWEWQPQLNPSLRQHIGIITPIKGVKWFGLANKRDKRNKTILDGVIWTVVILGGSKVDIVITNSQFTVKFQKIMLFFHCKCT